MTSETVQRVADLVIGVTRDCLVKVNGDPGRAKNLCAKLANLGSNVKCGRQIRFKPCGPDMSASEFTELSGIKSNQVVANEENPAFLLTRGGQSLDHDHQIPATCLLLAPDMPHSNSGFLHVAFDYDRVLVRADQGTYMLEPLGISAWHEYEFKQRDQPHEAGPLFPFFQWLIRARDHMGDIKQQGLTQVRVSIVTARSLNRAPRMMTTLKRWDVEPDRIHLMGASPKHPVLVSMPPDLYLDDSITHLQEDMNTLLCAHVQPATRRGSSETTTG